MNAGEAKIPCGGGSYTVNLFTLCSSCVGVCVHALTQADVSYVRGNNSSER